MIMACTRSRILIPKVLRLQPNRSKVVVKRRRELPVERREGVPITAMRLKERHYMYEVVSDDSLEPIPDIECILTTHVDGLGAKGQVVHVDRNLFRQELLLTGAAVYASPENIEEYKETDATAIVKTPHALQTYRMLCGINLPIRLNHFKSWTLTKANVLAAFRHAGVILESEDCITLPEEPITDKHNEQVPFKVGVKVNGLDEAQVTCYRVPFTTIPEREPELPQSLELPLHRPPEEVNAELREKGLYYGTVETL